MKRIHIIGRKNSGKTTLIVELIRHLSARGHRVGTVKHTHHRHELDTPGKDSYRHRTAGAVATAIVSQGTTAVFWSSAKDQDSPDVYEKLPVVFADCDFVLVEGDTRTDHPKVEVWRDGSETPPLAATDDSIRAVVTDDPISVPVPIWPRADLPGVARRVLEMLTE